MGFVIAPAAAFYDMRQYFLKLLAIHLFVSSPNLLAGGTKTRFSIFLKSPRSALFRLPGRFIAFGLGLTLSAAA
jgi:hypothetical protein